MNLTEVQDRTYELLCLIDDICRAEGVKYFLDGGTEIGSVREKDLIPWDDDVDIKMLWAEYPKFRRAMLKHLPPYIRLVEPTDFAPLFYDFVTRVVDTRYTLRKVTEKDSAYNNMENHVCVDVFLHYHVSAELKGRKAARRHVQILYGLGMGHRHKIDYKEYDPLQRIKVRCMSLAGRLIPAKTVCKWFNRTMDRYDRIKADSPWLFSTWVQSPTFQQAVWYESNTEGELRGRKFPIPVGYDEDLRMMYGDYMKPPENRDAYIQHLDPEDRYKD